MSYMTLDQIKDAIYSPFYEIIRIGQKPTPDVFFQKSIQDSFGNSPAPTDWPTFYYDAVALQIQLSFLKYGEYLPKFNGDWINTNKSKYKWQDVLDWACGTSTVINDSFGITDYPSVAPVSPPTSDFVVATLKSAAAVAAAHADAIAAKTT